MTKLDIKKMRESLNKTYGKEIAYDLNDPNNPTNVVEYVPTGSRLLDRVLVKRADGGWPVRKIIEIAGLPSTGKSYLALQGMKNALKMNMIPVIFDSESSWSKDFMIDAGLDPEEILYIQPLNVVELFDVMSGLLTQGERFFFVWDSLAQCPALNDQSKASYDPKKSMMEKPKEISRGLEMVTLPIAQTDSIFLILNQLQITLPPNPFSAPKNAYSIGGHWYTTSGGNKNRHTQSLRVYLTGKVGKAHQVQDEHGDPIGSYVKATVSKSRFGTLGRNCELKILWGDGNVRIMDEESWLDACVNLKSERFKKRGGWYTFITDDGEVVKFQESQWKEKLEDEYFEEQINKLLNDYLVNQDVNEEESADN